MFCTVDCRVTIYTIDRNNISLWIFLKKMMSKDSKRYMVIRNEALCKKYKNVPHTIRIQIIFTLNNKYILFSRTFYREYILHKIIVETIEKLSGTCICVKI